MTETTRSRTRATFGDGGAGARAAKAQTPDWQVAHDALVGLARTRAGLDFDEGRWLLVALRSGAHARLGYGSFAEYVERLFGYSPRLTHEKLRVAESLEELPKLGQAFRDGQTSWSVLRELTRVATPETEQAWLDRARGRTARDVEKLVSGHRPGSRPEDPVDAEARRNVLRFEVSGETFATFREAMARLRRDAGEPLDDDAALLLLARRVLGGPADEGRASYQVALTVCEECGNAHQDGHGERVRVGREVVAMAECDSQRLGSTHVGGMAGDDEVAQKRTLRATQDVPPALRRMVLRRDSHRCTVPGCRHAAFVDIHHIDTRADGGGHVLDNLTTLCGAHHRAAHRGELLVEGRVSTGLCFRHADGSPYGQVASPATADAYGMAFRGLRRMGFGEGEVRRALAQVRTHLGHAANTELVLRSALQALTDCALARAS